MSTSHQAVDVVVRLNRILWAITSPNEIPEFSGEPFALRSDELVGSTLLLKIEDPLPTIALVGSRELQRQWPGRDRTGIRSARLPLRVLADTARASHDAVLKVDLRPVGSDRSFTIGTIESRFEPVNLSVEALINGDQALLEVRWDEHLRWPNRVLRVWSADRNKIYEESVSDGECEALVEVPLVQQRLFVEVTTSSLWSGAKFPTIGPSCVPLDVTVPGALELRAAVQTGDSRYSPSDHMLDGLVPTMADLCVELLPLGGNEAQRRVLTTIALEDAHRAAELLCEIASRQSNADGSATADQVALAWLPYLFESSGVAPGEHSNDLLERLWDASPLAALCLDRPGSVEADDRWYRHAGWRVTEDCLGNLVDEIRRFGVAGGKRRSRRS